MLLIITVMINNMKIRTSFVTNSSSTCYTVISNKKDTLAATTDTILDIEPIRTFDFGSFKEVIATEDDIEVEDIEKAYRDDLPLDQHHFKLPNFDNRTKLVIGTDTYEIGVHQFNGFGNTDDEKNRYYGFYTKLNWAAILGQQVDNENDSHYCMDML